MITELLKNEGFVKQLERIARELEYLLEDETDFTFFFPKFLLNIEGLMKMYHPEGSNAFDYMTTFDNVIVANEELKDRYVKNIDKNNEKLRDVEYKVWKEGHENMVFEKIKNKLGYLPNPSVEIENDLNIKLWQQAKNQKKD